MDRSREYPCNVVVYPIPYCPMTRTLGNLVDQFLHFLWAASVLSAYEFIPVPVLNGAVAGLLIALPRELVDQWPIRRWGDTALDCSAFALGGAAVSLF